MTIRIDGTNSAANPGITGSDTDTGLQFGTDEVNIVTSGSTAVTVDSSQRVGIGTTAPDTALTVSEENVAVTSQSSNVNIYANDALAADIGGSIGHGATWNGTGGLINYASIHGKKANATSGNTDGYMSFVVRDNAGTSERLRINKDGALGIGGTAFGTSGQVLTSQGSGSAPQWATASDSIEYHLNEVSGSLPSGGLGITNLPSSIVKLSLVCFNFSGDQNQEFGFRVRANSTELSSNYYWTTMYAGSGGGGDGDYYSNYFATDGLASNGYTSNAIWTLTQGPGNRWFCEAHWNVNPTHSWGYVGTGFGYVDCGSSALDGLSFHPLGGNFDQGDYSLSYLTQT